jgi:predicted nucleic acid-binding protein
VATLVDTNVLIDVAVRDPVWLGWSRRRLREARERGSILINQIVLAEFSIRYDRPDDVDAALPGDEFRREGLPWAAAFAASRVFRLYRQSGGAREKILPDFFIGAHAAIRGYTVLTRDPGGYRTYFPSVELISPETHPLDSPA